MSPITPEELRRRVAVLAELVDGVGAAAAEIERVEDFDSFVSDVWNVLRLYELAAKEPATSSE